MSIAFADKKKNRHAICLSLSSSGCKSRGREKGLVDKGNEVSRAAGGLFAKMLVGRRKVERERVEEIGESASGRGRSGPLG